MVVLFLHSKMKTEAHHHVSVRAVPTLPLLIANGRMNTAPMNVLSVTAGNAPRLYLSVGSKQKRTFSQLRSPRLLIL